MHGECMNILRTETEEGAVRGMRYSAQSMNMSMSLVMSMMMDMGMPTECAG
jgi:hypothetical protein